MACTLVTCSATAINCGIGPKGLPSKSISNPAIITRTPLLASLLHTFTNSRSKNWASSIATTSTSLASNKILELEGTGVLLMALASCDTTSISWYRVSILGLKISTFCLANCARFKRRISSSVLPENILPHITSMLPFLFAAWR